MSHPLFLGIRDQPPPGCILLSGMCREVTSSTDQRVGLPSLKDVWEVFQLHGFPSPGPCVYLKALSKRWAIRWLSSPTLARSSSHVLVRRRVRARTEAELKQYQSIDDILQVYLQSMYLRNSFFGSSRPSLTRELPSFPAHM